MTRQVLAFALLVLAPSAAPARSDELRVGVAVVDITPPRGYRMAGYFSERFNTGTHDPLLAKAIVFRQGQEQAALVFCDLIDVPREVATKARERVSRRTGIPAANVAVAATHSHTGPLYHGVLRDQFHRKAVADKGKDEREAVDYAELLAARAAEVVARAQDSAAPARLAAGVARETRLSFNRRFHMKDGSVRFNPGPQNPEIVRVAGPTDPDVGLVVVRPEAGGAPVAALTVFALHLDTVGGGEYSGDYPAVLSKALQVRFGPGFVSLFGAGTCGDINHIDVTRRDRASTDAIGRTLAGTVLGAVDGLKPVDRPSLAVARAVVDVPLQRYPAGEAAEARKLVATFEPGRTPFLDVVKAVKLVDLADNYPAPTEPLEVQAFRLGPDLAVVTLPGEVFVEHGLAVKKGSPFATTLVVELANADPNYVPTRKAFAEGSYEVVNSRVAPGGGERLVDAALSLLKKLHEPTRSP
jgi:neutral ceramidase